MYNKRVIILLLLFVSAFTWTNNCPSYFAGDLLQTGKNSFIRSRGSNPQYNFDAPINFNVPSWGFELASSVSSIGDYNPSYAGFSYQLNGGRKGNTNFVQFTLIANTDGWSSMQVSWLASARDDFAVGNVQYPVNQWTRGSSANTYQLTQLINRNLADADYKVAVFISGFSTNDRQLRINLNNKSYDKINRRLSIAFYCGANPQPIAITFSYVIYPDAHSVFEISYETIPQGDSGAYQLTGPVNFGANIEYNEFRIANRYLTCTGNECDSSCILRERCNSLNGNSYEGQCIFCSPGIVFEYGTCTRRCGANQTYVNRVCICNSGYTRQGNNCVLPGPVIPTCNRNEILYNNRCRACPNGASPNQNTCVCPQGFSYDINNNVCNQNVVNCGYGQVWSGSACVCVNGFGRYNGQCIQCPNGAVNQVCQCASGFSYDAQTNRCIQVNNCPFGFRWNGFACVCSNSNQINFNGKCQSCPSNARPNDALNSCTCLNGFVYDGNSNRCNNRCGANEQFSNGVCVCVRGNYKYNGVCRACPSGSSPNAAQNTCVCNRNNQTFDIIANRCTATKCPQNQVWQNNGCVCANGFALFNNVCRQCPLNSVVSKDQRSCVCQDGFNYDSANNRCVNRCGPSQVWKNNKCICIDGYAWWNNQCRQCPKSAQPSADQNTCVCRSRTAIYYSSTNLCVECGANSAPNAARTGCQCLPGFVQQGSACVAIQCNLNEDYINGQCQCKYGFIRVGPACVDACGINQYWDGKNCYCKQGSARINGVCRQCPSGSAPSIDKTLCLCNDPKQYFDGSRCLNCPANSSPNNLDTDCICNAGYTKQNGQCISNCPSPAFPDSYGNCVCPNGNNWDGFKCAPPVVCPERSTFNSATSSCKCINSNENLIGGVCKPCGENSVWKQGECVCLTGFFNIGGVCRPCDPRTKYNGTDCICNLGYFGNRDLCTPCDKSCSQCSGPNANQCLACSDISLVLQNGYCTKNSPCDYGYFLDSGSCTKCLDNCIDCESIFECKTCAIGYKTNRQSINGQNIVSCDEICGDGIKFQQQCDDGNTINGDGCSNTCTEQPGWFCSGGSSSQPSICRKYIPDRVQISSKGAVNLGSQVILSVRASYLPSCITQNECATCFKAITANVINANVPILTTINYVPFSQYQFYLKFDFQGLLVTSTFKVIIRLNEQYKGCISQEDYNEQLQLTIDPAFLAKAEPVDQLTLDDINPDPSKPPTIKIPPEALRNLGA